MLCRTQVDESQIQQIHLAGSASAGGVARLALQAIVTVKLKRTFNSATRNQKRQPVKHKMRE
jgi:hypothetical protein